MARGKPTTSRAVEGNDDTSVQQVDQNVQPRAVDVQKPVEYISRANFEVLMKESMDSRLQLNQQIQANIDLMN